MRLAFEGFSHSSEYGISKYLRFVAKLALEKKKKNNSFSHHFCYCIRSHLEYSKKSFPVLACNLEISDTVSTCTLVPLFPWILQNNVNSLKWIWDKTAEFSKCKPTPERSGEVVDSANTCYYFSKKILQQLKWRCSITLKY